VNLASLHDNIKPMLTNSPVIRKCHWLKTGKLWLMSMKRAWLGCNEIIGMCLCGSHMQPVRHLQFSVCMYMHNATIAGSPSVICRDLVSLKQVRREQRERTERQVEVRTAPLYRSLIALHAIVNPKAGRLLRQLAEDPCWAKWLFSSAPASMLLPHDESGHAVDGGLFSRAI
jgi:hypothetical protein